MIPPRIVLDTNILVAALRSRRGASFRLLSLVGTGVFSVHLSVPLVLEYEGVLLRHEAELTVNAEDIGELLDYLCQVGEGHSIFFLWRPFLKDAEDDMLLELAVNAGCSHLVTFNLKDFTGAETFGIKVVTPGVLLEEIGDLS
jgi:predicted nucleic acid-binding protein